MRMEYKFLVSNRLLPEIRQRLQPYVVPDKFTLLNESKQYTVRSIYFDTARLMYYHEKIEGLRIRKKIRIRGYDQPTADSIIFLEIKRKYENYSYKNRASLYFRDLDSFFNYLDVTQYILQTVAHPEAREAAQRFVHHVIKNDLRPTVLVTYDREAFTSKFDNTLRITFDKNLRYLAFPTLSQLYQDSDLQAAMRNFFIIEIKFHTGYPQWLQGMLLDYQLSRQALSKYTICLDAQKQFRAVNRRTTLGFSERIVNGWAKEEEAVVN